MIIGPRLTVSNIATEIFRLSSKQVNLIYRVIKKKYSAFYMDFKYKFNKTVFECLKQFIFS